MNSSQDDLNRIKELLKESPHGLSVTEIARAIDRNKHSVGRYLAILHVSGQLEMRTCGKAKIFSLSSRVPLNSLLEFAPDLIIVLDRDFRVVRINDRFLELFSRTRDEIEGKNISFLPLSNQLTEILIEKIKASLTKGNFDQEIVIHTEKDNFYRQKIISTVFEDGAEGITVIFEDITAQKKAENALRSSEERFRLMADNIRDGLIIFENGKIAYANKQVEEIFGYPREELVSLSPSDLAAPEDRERIETLISKNSASGDVPDEFMFWVIRKDGTHRFLYNRITALEYGGAQIKYIIVTDMTEGIQMHQELHSQLSIFKNILNTLPAPHFYLDTKLQFVGCNEAFANLVGKNVEDFPGKTCRELFPRDQESMIGQYDCDILSGTPCMTYPANLPIVDGSKRNIFIRKSPVINPDGKIVGILGMVVLNQPESHI